MAETKHFWLVEIVEDDSASIQVDGRTVTPIPRWLLPSSAKEGDVLAVTHRRESEQSTIEIVIDPEGKQKLLERSEDQSTR